MIEVELPRAVFAAELLKIGPWKTRDSLKAAIRRGHLIEGVHFDRLCGSSHRRIFYLERIFPALYSPRRETHGKAEETAERLRRVLGGQS
jgi:hypothetical protein